MYFATKDIPTYYWEWLNRYLDTVIDGAGGDIVLQTYGLLKPGGVIVSYGMTTNPKVVFPMQAVLKNIEVSFFLIWACCAVLSMTASFRRDVGKRVHP